MRNLVGAAPLVLVWMTACGTTPSTPDGGESRAATLTLTSGTRVDLDALGVSRALEVTVQDAQGRPLPDAPVSWSRGATDVVTVTNTGTITSIGNGEDVITATSGSATLQIPVHVQQHPVTLVLLASRTTLTAGLESLPLQANLLDGNGRVITGVVPTFSSTNPGSLPVSPTGVVLARAPGNARIRATVGSLEAEVAVDAVFSGPHGTGITGQAVPCLGGTAGPFPCEGLILQSYLPASAVGAGQADQLNDIWGWTDPVTSREYALVGRRTGTSFVDITDPLSPRLVGSLPFTPGARSSGWRDIKVYADHAFIVADGANDHGMQVFDLRQLREIPEPQVLTATAIYTEISSAHNIVINEATGFGYIVGANGGGTTCGGGLHMVDLRTPAAPVFAGCFVDPATGLGRSGYTHDAQCVIYHGPHGEFQGHEICFGSNETALSIADVTTKSAPVALSRATYPAATYVHQGWLTEDHRYFFSNDELDESLARVTTTRTLIWDVQDLEDPILVGTYMGPTPATDHNHYVRGALLFASNYQFGIRVLNIASPTAPTQVGYFDTSPSSDDVPGFLGSWSNYPFFPSGNVVVTSAQEGLFVLRTP